MTPGNEKKGENPMRAIRIEKVTVNMGVGATGEPLQKAGEILKKITGGSPVQTKCKVKIPTWGIREGLPIGVKVTLRKKSAADFLKTALQAKENTLLKKNFDKNGNLGFGIKEYIDLPGAKYDPKMGIRGFDVLVTLERPGYRLKRRRMRPTAIGVKHRITKEDAMHFMHEHYKVNVLEKEVSR
ncbi:MAG: 50S ribosomal protein L5 [archaeon]